MGIYGLVLLVLNVVALWQLFVKAGDDGWKALIPFYSKYTYCKHGNCLTLFWVDLVLMIVSYLLTIFVGVTLVIAMFNFAAGGFLAEDPLEYVGAYLGISAVTALLLILAGIAVLIGSTVVNIFINIKFVKCYTDETIFKVLAGVGSFPPLHIALVVTRSILAFDSKYVYTKA